MKNIVLVTWEVLETRLDEVSLNRDFNIHRQEILCADLLAPRDQDAKIMKYFQYITLERRDKSLYIPPTLLKNYWDLTT